MRRQQALTAVLAALPGLVLAGTAYLNAQAKAAEARKAYEGYGDYVTEQLHRDEALLKALQDCQERTHPKNWHDLAAEGPTAAYMMPGPVPPEPQAQEVLDDVARSRGWRPGGAK